MAKQFTLSKLSETGPEKRRKSESGANKYPRLSKEQIAAVWERKTNPVSNRYIGAELTEKAILKFYAQLREPVSYTVAPRASEIAQKAFTTQVEQPANALATRDNVINIAAHRTAEAPAPRAEEVSDSAKTATTSQPVVSGKPPVETGESDQSAMSPASLDMEYIRRQIAGIHSGEAKRGAIINDSIPDVLQQFTELGIEADQSNTFKEAA